MREKFVQIASRLKAMLSLPVVADIDFEVSDSEMEVERVRARLSELDAEIATANRDVERATARRNNKLRVRESEAAKLRSLTRSVLADGWPITRGNLQAAE